MPMQAIPAPPRGMVQTAFALCLLHELLDGPAAVGQFDQPLQRRVRWQGTVIPFDLAALARQGTLAEQPPLRSRVDTRMTGGEQRATCCPVGPHGHELF